MRLRSRLPKAVATATAAAAATAARIAKAQAEVAEDARRKERMRVLVRERKKKAAAAKAHAIAAEVQAAASGAATAAAPAAPAAKREREDVGAAASKDAGEDDEEEGEDDGEEGEGDDYAEDEVPPASSSSRGAATSASGPKKAKKVRTASPGTAVKSKSGPSGPLTLTIVGGLSSKSEKLGGTFSTTYADGSAVGLGELRTLARRTFGNVKQHAIAKFVDEATGKVVSSPSNLYYGATLHVMYRVAIGCPQPLRVLLGGKRRGFGSFSMR